MPGQNTEASLLRCYNTVLKTRSQLNISPLRNDPEVFLRFILPPNLAFPEKHKSETGSWRDDPRLRQPYRRYLARSPRRPRFKGANGASLLEAGSRAKWKCIARRGHYGMLLAQWQGCAGNFAQGSVHKSALCKSEWQLPGLVLPAFSPARLSHSWHTNQH